MKVAIIHDTLNPCGGAEKLSLYMIKTLWELGYRVDLVTIEPTRWEKVWLVFGDNFRRYIADEVVIAPFRKLPSISGRYIEWFLRDIVGFNMKLRKNYDITIITKQLHVPVYADIIYVHFPDFYPGVEALYYPERYVDNVFLKAYSRSLHMISKLLLELFKHVKYKPLILTNSKFSRALIKRWLGVSAFVLYPPVDVEKFENSSVEDSNRDLIVTVGRIEQSKRIHIVPMVAKNVHNRCFVIIGSHVQKEYYSYLNKLIEDHGLKGRVKILVSLDDITLRKVLSRAKYFLHTTMYEHFGMAIVEAMGAGAIPIVHMKSGAWTDILEFGRYGFGYDNLEDIVKILKNDLELDYERELRQRIKKRSEYFSYKRFKDQLRIILDKLLEFGSQTSRS